MRDEYLTEISQNRRYVELNIMTIMLSTPLCEVNSLSFVSVLVCPIDGKLPLCFNIVGSHEPKKGKKFTFLISIHVYSPHKLELKEDHNEANSYAYFVCVACRIRCVI